MKQQFIKTYSIACISVGLLFTGCTKHFDKLNENPSSIAREDFDPNYLLTAAQLGYTGSRDRAFEVWRANIVGTSCTMQHFASIGGTKDYPGDKYVHEEPHISSIWGDIESGNFIEQVTPIAEGIVLTKGDTAYRNLHQASRIMKAMILQKITDVYGNIPYLYAGMGLYSGVYFPKYDSQEIIYADILKEIEEATNALDPAADKITGDLFFDGNIEQWKRLGNTLLLRAAMRLTKVDPEKAKLYVQKVLGKTMQSNADGAKVFHDAIDDRVTANRISLTFNATEIGINMRYSKTFIDFLKNNNDPRLTVVANLIDGDRVDNTFSKQQGLPNGYDNSGGTEDYRKLPGHVAGSELKNYSYPRNILLKKTSPTLVLTYALSELLLADAAQRWGVGGSAEVHYNNGVRAAMTQYAFFDKDAEVSDAAVNAYLAAHPYDATKGLEMINMQIWAATLFDGIEAWSNWRRTNYPVLVPVQYSNSVNKGKIPRRYPYPTTEAGTNPVNYNAARAAIPGGDLMTSRVWWDKE